LISWWGERERGREREESGKSGVDERIYSKAACPLLSPLASVSFLQKSILHVVTKYTLDFEAQV
jgi:hypothetical protein